MESLAFLCTRNELKNFDSTLSYRDVLGSLRFFCLISIKPYYHPPHPLTHPLLAPNLRSLLRHRHIDMNTLSLQIMLQPLLSTLPSMPTLFETTKRSLHIRRESAVDAHGPSLDLRRHPQRARDVGCIHRRFTKSVRQIR